MALASKTQSVCNLAALAGTGWTTSADVLIPGDSVFAVPGPPPRRRAAPRNRRGPITTGVPCNPEAGVGLMAVVTRPASTRLHVVERSTMAQTARRCCNGTCGTDYRGTSFCINESMLECTLCGLSMGGRNLYMYKDKGFCMPECRYEYFLQDLFEKRRMLQTGIRASRRATWAAAGVPESAEASRDRNLRRILFICD